jgi:uncharacterized phage-like protein YoqJ
MTGTEGFFRRFFSERKPKLTKKKQKLQEILEDLTRENLDYRIIEGSAEHPDSFA